MKRFVIALTIGLAVSALASSNTSASVNDFRFSSFAADYYLRKDKAGRSEMEIKERLVAIFPDFDQNHGIERAIPTQYDNHPVNLTIQTVTDDYGRTLPYSTYNSGTSKVVRIGDPHTYVHGEQLYRITYTVHDVTRKLHNSDELYWNVNGTWWRQSFTSVSAKLHIPKELQQAYDGHAACYAGAALSNSSTYCTASADVQPNETIVSTTTTRQLNAGENLAFFTGFKAGTFKRYVKPPMPLWQKIIIPIALTIGVIWYIIVPVYAIAKGLKRWRLSGRDVEGKNTIVPEYLPPSGKSVLLASVILSDRLQNKAVSATIIDLSVRHYMKVYEIEKGQYELELAKDIGDLLPEEQRVVTMFFGSAPTLGDRVNLKDKSSLYTEIAELGRTIYDQTIGTGLMADTRKSQKHINLAGGLLLGFSIVTFSIFGIAVGIALLIIGNKMPARTLEGIELKEYLLGLKAYMQMAEAERIQQLQSPSGAERMPIDTTDNSTLIKLYERLLPYAILFGIETEWAGQFAHLYTAPPDWYSGTSPTFNAAYFAASLGSFSSSTSASFSPPTSSGGSSGGFSGAGGGGGGGGW